MAAELKQCPFCGGEAGTRVSDECHGHGFYLKAFYVYCKKCGSRGEQYRNFDYSGNECARMAIEAWNRRAQNG